jgi:hypothetical protein
MEEIGKSFVLQKIALDTTERMSLLGSSLTKPGNIAEMKSVISELMLYGIKPEDLAGAEERKQKDRGGRAEAEGQSRYGGICSRMTAFGVRWLFFVHICKKNRYSAGKVCIQFALRNKKSIVYCIRTREKRTTQNLKGGSPQYLSLRKHFPDDGWIRRNPVLQGAGKLFYVRLIRNAKK